MLQNILSQVLLRRVGLFSWFCSCIIHGPLYRPSQVRLKDTATGPSARLSVKQQCSYSQRTGWVGLLVRPELTRWPPTVCLIRSLHLLIISRDSLSTTTYLLGFVCLWRVCICECTSSSSCEPSTSHLISEMFPGQRW